MTWRALALVATLLCAACNRGGLPASDDAAVGGSTDGAAPVDLAAPDLVAPIACGGLAGMGCPAGMFCQTRPGECCCDIPGACLPIPSVCDKSLAPVCGCDGKTYDNDCLRQQAGASTSYPGPCAAPFLCGGATCQPSQVCYQGCSGIGPPPPPSCAPAPPPCNGHPTCACIPPQPMQDCQDVPDAGVLLTQSGCA